MAVTKLGPFLLLPLLYFPTPILMFSREICQCWELTTGDDYFNKERRDVLGNYFLDKDSDETEQQFYHRKKFTNDGNFTIWYDTTPQWAIYKNKFTKPPMTYLPNGTAIVDQRPRVIQTSCNEPFLDDCRTFNFTYYHPGKGDVVDSTMTLTCIDIGSRTPEGSSLISQEVVWLRVLSVCGIVVIVMLVIVMAFIFPKRSNLRNDYTNKNKSYTSLNRTETTEMEDLQHHNYNIASQARQISVPVETIDVEVGLLQKTVHNVGNDTQAFEAQPIKSCEKSIGDGINTKETEAINVCTTGDQDKVHGSAMGGPQLVQQQQPTILIQGQEPLTLSMLAAASPQEKKKMLGERVLQLVQGMHPEIAGKITGVLLEIDNLELFHMLLHGEMLKEKVVEAISVLQAKESLKYHQCSTEVKEASSSAHTTLEDVESPNTSGVLPHEVVPDSRNDTGVENISCGLLIAPNMHTFSRKPSSV